MPLFEYSCKQCGREFEALVRGTDVAECPMCHTTDLERRLSVFAAHTSVAPSSADAMATGCGHCGDPRGPGACSMN